ncbi:MAG: GFA family protein [Polyangiaceae bacterium]
MQPVRGSCLCGGVAYEMTEPPIRALHCHCSRCRKVRGTGHATNLVTALSGVRFLRGEELLTRFKAPDATHFAHVFCKACGSSMPNVDPGRDIVVIPMGSFDDDPGTRPQGHIWVESMPAWDEITDALPQHPTYPP